ncbi:MAG: hypothetical protein NTX61_11900 [Bacteroidetes bacterium]|nr:hypothetical protein [Bacteroidota bacterium]
MKTNFIILTVLGIALCFSGCKKKSTDDQNNSSKTIFSSKFETQAELNAWSQTSGGKAFIDGSAVKFDSITGCFHFETINLIPVKTGKSYELRLTGKVNYHLAGDPVLCAGDFIIWLVQGNTNLIDESFGNYPNWTQRSFSFTATSSASVKIEFLIGSTRGAWIDDIALVEL